MTGSTQEVFTTQQTGSTTQQTVAAAGNTESQVCTSAESEGMARSRTTASLDAIPPDTSSSSPVNLMTLAAVAAKVLQFQFLQFLSSHQELQSYSHLQCQLHHSHGLQILLLKLLLKRWQQQLPKSF
jgi:hypothetical protein